MPGAQLFSTARVDQNHRWMIHLPFGINEWKIVGQQTIQVDRAGRVVLPKPIRKRFNLLPGDKLRLSADESGIRLEPEEVVGSLVRKGNVLVFTGEFSERITDEVIDRMLEEDRQGKTHHLDQALRRK